VCHATTHPSPTHPPIHPRHQGDTTKLVDDIGALKPTMFIGVPRIFDRIYGAVTGQIQKAGEGGGGHRSRAAAGRPWAAVGGG